MIIKCIEPGEWLVALFSTEKIEVRKIRARLGAAVI